MASYCSKAGAELRTGARIVAVDPVAHTVRDEGGTVFTFRQLLWAADLKTLFQLVDIDRLPEGQIREHAKKRASVLGEARGGDSVFTLYLGVELEPGWFAAKSNGHFFYTPSKSGVGPAFHERLDALLVEVASSEDGEIPEAIGSWVEHYILHTTYEISIPALKDASLAPEGKTGLIVSVLFDHALWETARLQGWYDRLKTLAEDRLLEGLDASVYPGLRQAVTTRFSSTPVTIADAVGSADGAITGWAFTNAVMPAVHKMQHVAKSVATPFPDISQAGQWAYSPSGLPIAILTGKLAADRMTSRLGDEEKRKR